jgi:hypothetical protein
MFPSQTNRIRLGANVDAQNSDILRPPGATKTGTGPPVAKKSENIFLPDIVFVHRQSSTGPGRLSPGSRKRGNGDAISNSEFICPAMSSPVANVRSTLRIRTQTESSLSAAFVFGGAAILWMPRSRCRIHSGWFKMGTAAPGFVDFKCKLIVGTRVYRNSVGQHASIWAVANAVAE